MPGTVLSASQMSKHLNTSASVQGCVSQWVGGEKRGSPSPGAGLGIQNITGGKTPKRYVSFLG